MNLKKNVTQIVKTKHQTVNKRQSKTDLIEFYLAELVEVQNLSLHVREADLGSLQLPELCDLIQKVELNPCEGLEIEGEGARGSEDRL